nr:protein erp5 [Quercus suber]
MERTGKVTAHGRCIRMCHLSVFASAKVNATYLFRGRSSEVKSWQIRRSTTGVNDQNASNNFPGRSTVAASGKATRMRTTIGLFSLAYLIAQTQALYFYIHNGAQKCFFEELPKDTLVVGHYKATQWNEQSRSYITNNDMGIRITVDETFDNDHRVVNQHASHSGKFTFSAADAGDHRLCFTATNVPSPGGFLYSGQPAGGIKFELDMVIGETSRIESSDKDKMGEMVQKVKDLHARLQDLSYLRAFFIKQKLT